MRKYSTADSGVSANPKAGINAAAFLVFGGESTGSPIRLARIKISPKTSVISSTTIKALEAGEAARAACTAASTRKPMLLVNTVLLLMFTTQESKYKSAAEKNTKALRTASVKWAVLANKRY